MFFRTVRVQKLSRYINNICAVPVHNKPRLGFNLCHNGGFKVFALRYCYKPFNIFFFNNNRHSLLRFAYGKLRSVKPFILFRYGIKVYFKSVRKLADCNRYSACAKIITPLYEPCGFFVSEKPLEFSFLRCVTLLNFRTASFKRRKRMRL